MQTTADDVQRLFAGSVPAQAEYSRWAQSEARRGVHAVALGHVSRHVYGVKPLQVRRLAGRINEDSERRWPRGNSAEHKRDLDALHPLGRILAGNAADKRARNWSPPMSFNLAFHVLLERRQGELFTIQDFREACSTDREVLWPLLGKSASELIAQVKYISSEATYDKFLDAMTWRVGCAYYSFLKEVYVLSCVRDEGVDLRLHPLADTLFRMDFWGPQSRALSLYVPNDLYASEGGEEGRKPPMEKFVQDLFSYRRFELPVPKLFGSVELPRRQVIGDITRWVQA